MNLHRILSSKFHLIKLKNKKAKIFLTKLLCCIIMPNKKINR